MKYPEHIIDLLISPDDGSELLFDSESGLLKSSSGAYDYRTEEGVPVLLRQKARELAASSDQHNKLNTEFYYTDHYQVDAEEFDYFEISPDGAMLDEIRRLHETIINEVPKDTKRVVDVGCGSAWVAEYFCPRGVEVISMDISTINPIKALHKVPSDNHFGLVADVFNLPFRSGSLECIIASEIIEHVPDPAAFIQALLKALKPGGHLIITTPYDETIVYTLCIHCNRPTPMHAHLHSFTPRHLRVVTPKPFQEGLKIYGFGNKALIRLKTYLFLRFLPFGIWKWIDKLTNAIVKKPSRIMYKAVARRKGQ